MDDIENVRTEDIMRKIQCNPMFNIVLQLECIITITSGRGGGGGGAVNVHGKGLAGK